jgi:hypothetical protein
LREVICPRFGCAPQAREAHFTAAVRPYMDKTGAGAYRSREMSVADAILGR